MSLPLSKDERDAHARAVNEVLKHHLASDARDILAKNLAQLTRPLDDGELEMLSFTLQQYTFTMGMITRLEALGIDPDAAMATDEEAEASAEKLRRMLPSSIGVAMEMPRSRARRRRPN